MDSNDNYDTSLLVKPPRSYSNVGDDQVIEAGNIASSSSQNLQHLWGGQGNDLSYTLSHQRNKERWLMNYQEATIYLEEGENNEKFDTHPKSQADVPAYLIAHHPFFHVVDILASLLLLSLAVIEKPAVNHIQVPIYIHASLELLGITILTIDLIVKVRWQGIQTFLTHKRTLLKCLLLLVMVSEAITVIVRQSNHFRVTRALRPLFLLDTYYCRGIRRFCRQVFQSLPPILELLFLLLFVMFLFSILGFYLFSSNDNSIYFETLPKSFLSLFVLLTTANYPDVMMPAYATSHISALFFIVYISIELYFFMNLFLAVVYNTFTSLEKSKVKKLMLHRRHACEHAFRLLVSKRHRNSISLCNFAGLMKFYRPGAKKIEIYLTFKALNSSCSGSLSLEEFYNIYSLTDLNWKETSKSDFWFQKLPGCLRKMMASLNWFVNWKWFDYFVYLVICGNFIVILYEAIVASTSEKNAYVPGYTHGEQLSWHSIMFTGFYILEALLKILGLGPTKYFTDGWNLFDLGVTVVSLVGLFGDLDKDRLFFFIILRPFRLIRIFKARKRYRDVLGTLFILADQLWSLVVTLMLLYYFYAIIGMECFSYIDMLNCCKNNSAIAPYYSNMTDTGYYYLNNFDDIFISGVTLFELTVVNNWFIIMEGYAITATEFSRIYFMTFYIVTMVVMTVVVAFILEAFMFKIGYRHQTNENSSIDYLIHTQTLSVDETHMINNTKMSCWSGDLIRNQSPAAITDFHFLGKKKRGKIELSLQMYKDEIQDWIEEEKVPTPEVVTSSVQPDIVPRQPPVFNRLDSYVSISSDIPCVSERENNVQVSRRQTSSIV